MDDDEEDESFAEGDIITYELNGQEMQGRIKHVISEVLFKLEDGKIVSREEMRKLEDYDLVEDESEDDGYERYVDDDEDG